jgi:hypothetical protein
VTIELSVHEVTVAVTPLNVTVFEPIAGPKFSPVIVTVDPAAAGSGKMAVTLGVSGLTVSWTLAETAALLVLFVDGVGVNVALSV